MRIPDWVQNILSVFESQNEPFQELEIADALRSARNNYGDLDAEDWKGFVAEWSAFLFGDRRKQDSVWGTHFAPAFSATKSDGGEFYSPDIKDLDSVIVDYWEERATACANPVMRARYSDLVWDLKRAITGEKQNHKYARMAVDSYLEATDRKFYTMEVNGIDWLGRALDLSRSLSDPHRIKSVVNFMFEFYERIAQFPLAGTWLFLFDKLYGENITSPEDEERIIAYLESMLAKASDATQSQEGVYLTLDPWHAQAAAERLARHYQRIKDKTSVERVIKAYGKAFEPMARQANPMVAMAWLQPIIERYEQEGLKSEAEQLQQLASEKGKNIGSDLKTISVKVDIKQDDIDRLIENLIGSGNLVTSLERLAGYFIPRVSDTRKLLDTLRTESPLQSMIPIIIVERDGRPKARIGSIDEDADGRLHQQLAQSIGFYQPFLVQALARLKERYAPSVDDILDFLCKSPLFAKCQTGLLKDGLIAYQQEDFVKAIHVLVPQIEHVLRQFLGSLNVPTLKTVKGYPGIMDAKSMGDILGDDRMRSVLTEDLWRYLAVVYIDKRGLNLRNDLAHGLVPKEAFKKHVADRIFHTLLALSLMRAQKKAEGE
jgi:uncharacterized protein DUF4209